jgi:hypothetical protein
MQTVTDSERPTPAATLFAESPLEEAIRHLTGQLLEIEDDGTELAKADTQQRAAISAFGLKLAEVIEYSTYLAGRIQALETAVGKLRSQRTGLGGKS